MGKKQTAVFAALAIVVLAAAPALADGGGGGKPTSVQSVGPLRDLVPATADVTDGAYAEVKASTHHGSTKVKLRLEGLNPSYAGQVFGAHVHSGNCIAGNPDIAGPHYNAGGGISDHTEVWLDFTVGKHGRAGSETEVEFTIPAGGASAVVIHAMATVPATGGAGPRLACLPVPF